MLAGDIDLVIYFGSIKHWQPPHANETISLDEKNVIKENVTEALEEKGLVVEWE